MDKKRPLKCRKCGVFKGFLIVARVRLELTQTIL